MILKIMHFENRKPGRPRDEQQMARRKEEILVEATRVFARQGFRLTDVQLIADHLGIGKGTVYRHFPSKEALFFAAVDRGIRGLIECVQQAGLNETDPIRRIRNAVRAYLGYFDRHPELVELLIIERAEFRDRKQATYFAYKQRSQEKNRGFLEQAMRDGIIRRMSVDRILNVISDTLYGTIFTNHFSRRKVPFEEQADSILEIIFQGILFPGNLLTTPESTLSSKPNRI